MSDFDLVIKAVLEKELSSSPPLMPVVVAKIIGTKKDIPKAFRLTKDMATADLKHLRRLRNLPSDEMECILSRSLGNSESDWRQEIEKLRNKFATENIFDNYRVVMVPTSAPKTHHQLRACMEIWPCKFAKNNYLIQCIDGSVFTEAETLVLKIIVNNTINHIKLNPRKWTSGAVVFRYAQVYGVGLSSDEVIHRNPIMHSSMICIDSVATNANAGHWKCSSGIELQNLLQSQLDGHKELKSHRIEPNFSPYLCTNYDIFITEEPCLMCTMGLVQSRIRRLFYLDGESIDKLTQCKRICYPDEAIGEFLIHRDRSLNHRFEAWKITLLANY